MASIISYFLSRARKLVLRLKCMHIYHGHWGTQHFFGKELSFFVILRIGTHHDTNYAKLKDKSRSVHVPIMKGKQEINEESWWQTMLWMMWHDYPLRKWQMLCWNRSVRWIDVNTFSIGLNAHISIHLYQREDSPYPIVYHTICLYHTSPNAHPYSPPQTRKKKLNFMIAYCWGASSSKSWYPKTGPRSWPSTLPRPFPASIPWCFQWRTFSSKSGSNCVFLQ